jgi:hypothetical protein
MIKINKLLLNINKNQLELVGIGYIKRRKNTTAKETTAPARVLAPPPQLRRGSFTVRFLLFPLLR